MAGRSQVVAAIDGPNPNNERMQALLTILRSDKVQHSAAADLETFQHAKAHGCLIERKTADFHYIMCYATGCECTWSRPVGCADERTIADKRAAVDHVRNVHWYEVDA